MANDALLRLERVTKRFPGGTLGLDAIDLTVAEGEFLSLLGPSGCGKTTTLRVVAGFETPTEGRLVLDGRDVTALKPHARPVNTVFQDYALFPHMTVAENVDFGLSLRKIPPQTAAAPWREALARVGLAEKASSRVQALSAASASGWRSPAPSCASPACSSSTSRCRHSTRTCANACSLN